MTRNDLDKWIVAIHSKEELDEILEMLKIENKPTLLNFAIVTKTPVELKSLSS